MSSSVFEPALDEMAGSGSAIFGPTSFLGYVDDHGLDAGSRTPKYISTDAVSALDGRLRANQTMVLRLGSATDGRGTQFALVRAGERVEEFFLVDGEIFDEDEGEEIESTAAEGRMLGFRALPNLSETSLVNLGLASGVVSRALEIDHGKALLPPATGRSRFSFDVRPRAALDMEFRHRSGQVEVDTLFAERRNGRRVLFVIEAKTGTKQASLAKHKLAYPVYAIADRVPEEVEIVPVYLRIVAQDEKVTYHVVECSFPDPRETLAAIDEVQSRRYEKFLLRY